MLSIKKRSSDISGLRSSKMSAVMATKTYTDNIRTTICSAVIFCLGILLKDLGYTIGFENYNANLLFFYEMAIGGFSFPIPPYAGKHRT